MGTVLPSVVLFAIRRFRTAPASTVLRLGMVAPGRGRVRAVSLPRNAQRWDRAVTALGHSAVGCGLVVVGCRGAESAVVDASDRYRRRHDVAAGLSPQRHGRTGPGAIGPFVSWLLVNYVAAGVAYAGTRAPPRALPTSRRRGTKIGGYRLVKRIGEGGMGEVWKAAHKMLARTAAIRSSGPM